MKHEKMQVAVEGSSDLSIFLPHNKHSRMMNYAETYLMSCYAIWIAASDDNDERAIALRNQIMTLTLQMMEETDEDYGSIH